MTVRTLTIYRVLLVCATFVGLIGASQVAIKSPSRPNSAAFFGSFWESGKAVARGENPYVAGEMTWSPELSGVTVSEVNLNPPALLPLFEVFAKLDVLTSARLWVVAATLLFLVPAAFLVRRNAGHLQPYQVAWLMLSPMTHTSILFGQIYTLMFALSVAAYVALIDRRQIVAGLAIGILVAMKPNFAIWPALLLLSGHWRPALTAGAVAFIASSLPVMLYGPEVYQQWSAALRLDNHEEIFAHEVSLRGFFLRMGFEPAGVVLATCVLFVSAFLSWRTRPSISVLSGLAITSAILCSPLAWADYTLLLAPVMLGRRWNPRVMIAALLLLVPLQVSSAAVGQPAVVVTLIGAVLIAPTLLLWTEFVRMSMGREAERTDDLSRFSKTIRDPA